jgi:membrane-bound lytic murein transglycosylase B
MQTEGCLARRQMTVPLPVETWKKLGVTLKGGTPLAEKGLSASLVSGRTRHFLVYPNYLAILEYNCVNAYGLSVALLADASKMTAAAKASSTKPAKKTRK